MQPRQNQTAALGGPKSPQATVYSPTHIIAWPVIMLFILAYVEAVCYMGLFQTLTGYISGATILLAAEFFRPDGEYMTKVLVSFIPCTFLWVVLKEHYSGWRYLGAIMFVIEAALLTLYLVVATSLSPLTGSETPATMVIVFISVLAMSLHNVHSLQVMPEKAQIAITGLFGNFAGSTVHLLALARAGNSTTDAADAFKKLLYPLIALFGGAFLGALGFNLAGGYCTGLPDNHTYRYGGIQPCSTEGLKGSAKIKQLLIRSNRRRCPAFLLFK